MTDSGPGQIITFYSYKGGTGRTMAMANVAWIIASNGKRVLTVDWDLESPGLHKFFHPFLDPSTVEATPGVIEIINDYASAATSYGPRSDDWYLDCARVERHAVSLDWTFPDGGRLDFLSAGRQNRDYSSAVCSLDWDNFYDRLGGGQFFRALREDMKRNYDYVLIDSRTGLSDVADICTIELPDVLTVCFTLSDQSIEGAANVARQISGRYRERNIRVLPVPMRIEDGEKEKLDIGRSPAPAPVGGLPGRSDPGDRRPVLGVGRGALQAVLRLRGDPGHVRRRPGLAGLAAVLVRAHHRFGDRRRDLLAAPDPGGSPAAVQGDLRPAAAVGADPGVPELRARGPHVGRLDRGLTDPGRVPGRAAQHDGQRPVGQCGSADRTGVPERTPDHRRALVGLHAFGRGPGHLEGVVGR